MDAKGGAEGESKDQNTTNSTTVLIAERAENTTANREYHEKDIHSPFLSRIAEGSVVYEGTVFTAPNTVS
jgi:hypothetical protein